MALFPVRSSLLISFLFLIRKSVLLHLKSGIPLTRFKIGPKPGDTVNKDNCGLLCMRVLVRSRKGDWICKSEMSLGLILYNTQPSRQFRLSHKVLKHATHSKTGNPKMERGYRTLGRSEMAVEWRKLTHPNLSIVFWLLGFKFRAECSLNVAAKKEEGKLQLQVIHQLAETGSFKKSLGCWHLRM